MKKDYCVIGLGRFGKSVIETLVENNLSVMALDLDRKLIDEIAPDVAFSTNLDSTNITALKDVGIQSFSHIFVTIGENVEASIMTCAALVELGITNITARAKNSGHEMVLRKMGIKDIVKPEELTGASVAVRIATLASSDIISVSKQASLVNVRVENMKMSGTKVVDSKILNAEDVRLTAISRRNKTIWPDETTLIELNDILHIVAANKLIKQVEKEYS